MIILISIVAISIFSFLVCLLIYILCHSHILSQKKISHDTLREDFTDLVVKQKEQVNAHFLQSLKTITESVQISFSDVRSQLSHAINHQSSDLCQKLEKIAISTDKKLSDISCQVDKKLSIGFEKTTTTFTDIVKRLALIDEAQKKITELSSNVMSLQEILNDKRARGTFGEIQLSTLLNNSFPKEHFNLQHTLSNGKRVDCILFLPHPTGNITIDAKFPLENYQIFTNPSVVQHKRKAAQQQFRLDIKRHINDIAEKYIIPKETADGAIMFIPSESIFAEIHGNYPDLVEISQRSKVWLTSPTTLVAILTTARAAIKDQATRKQIHTIQEHLVSLSKDFGRFQVRISNLAKHISQANQDANEINKSATKITNRFNHIEQVNLSKNNSQDSNSKPI